MRKKSIITAIVLTLSIGIGATVYASTNSNESTQPRLGLGRTIEMRGHEIMTSTLSKLGLTDKDITDGLSAGKTYYDIAEAKGISSDKFKETMIQEKSNAIDAAVKNGLITKEQGDSLKVSIKTNMNNCTTPGENSKNNNGTSCGRGNRCGSGMGFTNIAGE